VCFRSVPFTSYDAVIAHEKAFEYFKGQPREIIYDQDRIFITEENYGDVLLTREFSVYCSQMDFKPIFCRKSDPESKGKVENVVGYVKKNFLRGRIYEGEDKLSRPLAGNVTTRGGLTRWGAGGGFPKNTLLPFWSWGLLVRLLFGCVLSRRAPGNSAARLPGNLALPGKVLLRLFFFFTGFPFCEAKVAGLRGKIRLFHAAGDVCHFFVSSGADKVWLCADGSL
jgi:hypothetical protein